MINLRNYLVKYLGLFSLAMATLVITILWNGVSSASEGDDGVSWLCESEMLPPENSRDDCWYGLEPEDDDLVIMAPPGGGRQPAARTSVLWTPLLFGDTILTLNLTSTGRSRYRGIVDLDVTDGRVRAVEVRTARFWDPITKSWCEEHSEIPLSQPAPYDISRARVRIVNPETVQIVVPGYFTLDALAGVHRAYIEWNLDHVLIRTQHDQQHWRPLSSIRRRTRSEAENLDPP